MRSNVGRFTWRMTCASLASGATENSGTDLLACSADATHAFTAYRNVEREHAYQRMIMCHANALARHDRASAGVTVAAQIPERYGRACTAVPALPLRKGQAGSGRAKTALQRPSSPRLVLS